MGMRKVMVQISSKRMCALASCLLSFPHPIHAKIPASEKSNATCELYLATSSIPNAGMGIFTGMDILEGDLISAPDICLPIMDLKEFSHHQVGNYIWYGRMIGSNEIDAFCP